jgi:hypothetical protein
MGKLDRFLIPSCDFADVEDAERSVQAESGPRGEPRGPGARRRHGEQLEAAAPAAVDIAKDLDKLQAR